MPFHVRKSVSAGPFRFNLSSGGVGLSVGVKGLRVGTGPRGHYVQAGRGGFYYRASLGRPGAARRRVPVPTPRPGAPRLKNLPDDGMIEVTSGEVLAMQDTGFADLLSELNAKHRQVSAGKLLGWGGALIAGLVLLAAGATAIAVLLLVPLAWAIGAWLDTFKRTAVLFYDVQDQAETRYRNFCAAFDGLASCASAWHIEAGQAVQDLTTWKRNAGVSHLVRRTPTTLSYALPTVLRCNITPPALKIGRRTIYFLPDVALVGDATGFGAVGYDALRLASQPSNFVETGPVPRDAQVSHHTWEHPNKSGGPDRRFKSNWRLPVCVYEAMHLTSASGVNELLEFSRVGYVSPLATAIKAMPKNQALKDTRLLSASG